jgi:hypothetical protein
MTTMRTTRDNDKDEDGHDNNDATTMMQLMRLLAPEAAP